MVIKGVEPQPWCRQQRPPRLGRAAYVHRGCTSDQGRQQPLPLPSLRDTASASAHITPSCRIEFSSRPQLPGSVPMLHSGAAGCGMEGRS